MVALMKLLLLVSIAQVLGKVFRRESDQKVLTKDLEAPNVPATNAKTAAAKNTPKPTVTAKSAPNKAQDKIISHLADMRYIGKNNSTFKLITKKTCSTPSKTNTALQAFLGVQAFLGM